MVTISRAQHSLCPACLSHIFAGVFLGAPLILPVVSEFAPKKLIVKHPFTKLHIRCESLLKVGGKIHSNVCRNYIMCSLYK
jgi:hypothetical protein